MIKFKKKRVKQTLDSKLIEEIRTGMTFDLPYRVLQIAPVHILADKGYF